MSAPALSTAQILANCQAELRSCGKLLQQTQEEAIPGLMVEGMPSMETMEKIQNIDLAQQLALCVADVLAQISESCDGHSSPLETASLAPRDVALRIAGAA